MLRQARLDYPVALHDVIGRGIGGLYIFNELKDKRGFLRCIKKRLDESSLRIYGWCLMGNHFHINQRLFPINILRVELKFVSTKIKAQTLQVLHLTWVCHTLFSRQLIWFLCLPRLMKHV